MTNMMWGGGVWGVGCGVRGVGLTGDMERTTWRLFRTRSMKNCSLGFRVHGLGLKVQSSGFRVQDSGFEVWGLWFRIRGLEFGEHVLGLRV